MSCFKKLYVGGTSRYSLICRAGDQLDQASAMLSEMYEWCNRPRTAWILWREAYVSMRKWRNATRRCRRLRRILLDL